MDDSTLRVLNLPKKFSSLREHQDKAIRDIATFREGYLMQIAPTGIGKSLIYICGSMLKGGNTVILTSTKALQDQLMRDFPELVEVRGRSNYRCDLTRTSAAYGPCRWGHRCALKSGGCHYYDALTRAKEAELVVTNYAFWLCSDLLGTPSNLVLDEAHASFDHLISHYAVEIDLNLLEFYMGRDLDLNDLKNTQVAFATVERELQDESTRILQEGGDFKALGPLSSLCENLRSLRSLLKAGHDYVEERRKRKLHIHPITAPSYMLFKDARSVIMTSATVGRGTADLLGLHDVKIREYESCFHRFARPVYMLPGIPMDRNTTQEGYESWVELIDKIIRSRKGHKGVVHTVSYKRQNIFTTLSDTGPHMAPKAKEVADAIRQFKASEEPVVLVSPSVTTGYDFPGDECRFQIVGKVPFPDTRSKVQERRAELFPSYPFYYAWQQITQAAGRGVRSEDDWCETFIVDSHFKWLRNKYKHLAQRWFLSAIQRRNTIPRRILNGWNV